MSNRMIFSVMSVLSLSGLVACQTPGPDAGRGAMMYRATCATCHEPGSTPQGPGLTTLAAVNGGSFPMDMVIAIIDGRQDVRAHGSPMPVWGDSLSEGEVRDLADYLATMQQ